MTELRTWAARQGLSRERFTGGDWAGAALAALGGVGAMLAVVTIGLLLIGFGNVPDISTGNVIAAIAMGAALAVGGTVDVAGVSGFGVDGNASVALSPLSVTAIGFTVVATIFVRRLRARGAAHITDGLLQAARVWIVLLACLLVVCLVGRFQVSSAPTSGGAAFGVPGLHVTTDIASTLFFGSCWLITALTVAITWRLPGLLPPRARGWREMASGPAAGALTALVLSCVAAVLFLIVVGLVNGDFANLAGSGASVTAVLGNLLLLGPNLLLAAFGFAIGVPLAANSSVLPVVTDLTEFTSISLLDLTDRDPRFWFVPLVVGVAIMVGGLITALHASSPQEARRSGWWLGITLGAALLTVALSTSVSVSGGLLDVSGDVNLHLYYLIAPLFGFCWGALGGWIGALLAPGMPATVIDGVRGHIVRARQRVLFAATTHHREPYPNGPHTSSGPATERPF